MAEMTVRPERDDPELDVIRKRGFQHEQRFLDDLRAEGKIVAHIELDGSIEDRGDQVRAAAAATRDAIAQGPDVIYQLHSSTGRGAATPNSSAGRVPGPAVALRPIPLRGGGHLACPPRQGECGPPTARTSSCWTGAQGIEPERMHVALGGSAHAVEPLRVDDYMAYYRAAKPVPCRARRSGDTALPSGPRTRSRSALRRVPLGNRMRRRRRDDDHLSLVAGISARQRRALTDRGVATLEDLGRLPSR